MTYFVPDIGLPTPKESLTNPRIRPTSPLAMIGLFVEVVRMRFQASVVGTDLPWVWDEDVNKTTIAIESAYNEDKEVRDKRPAIFIDVDGATLGRVVVGDRVGMANKTSQEGFWSLDTQPILMECVAAKKGESYLLADLVRIYLHASSDLIQASFGLHEMTPIVISRTQPLQKDKDCWITPLTFSVQVNVKWTTTPTRPLLNEIITKISTSSDKDATTYFQRVAVPQGLVKTLVK